MLNLVSNLVPRLSPLKMEENMVKNINYLIVRGSFK